MSIDLFLDGPILLREPAPGSRRYAVELVRSVAHGLSLDPERFSVEFVEARGAVVVKVAGAIAPDERQTFEWLVFEHLPMCLALEVVTEGAAT